ncbi:MAG: hypothetical protein V9G29_02895 [Burkholderiaceae bacterium]
MSMRLARLRDEVRHELGQTGAVSTIDDAAIDHALAQSLVLLSSHYPSVRAVLTIVTSGNTQDLKLAGAQHAQAGIRTIPVRRRLSAAAFVQPCHRRRADGRFLHVCAAGRRAECWSPTGHCTPSPACRRDESDTLPETEEYEHPLIVAAAGHLLALEATRLTITPNKDAQAAGRQLREPSDNLTERAIDAACKLGGAAQNPVWSNIGL